MLSMTGFGKARVRAGQGWLVAEVSSVNRKQLEVVVSLPRECSELENEVREAVMPAATRGRVQVAIYYMPPAGTGSGRINHRLAEAYARELGLLRGRLRLAGEVTLSDVLRAPGVVGEAPLPPREELGPALRDVARRAVADWQRMRRAEGRHLQADLRRRLARMRAAATRIARRAPAVVEGYRRALERRMLEFVPDADTKAETFRREVFHFADRCDITEELTRLQSHFVQFASFLRNGEGNGRRLEFLLQEIHREANTVGSKANDVAVAHEVVELKSEIEKVREQVQNLE
ncbi:MAG: YicC family protein [Verrucomicrobiae bacterium]|nr:YicC family protein [Verrucomicrobiae bacterium]